jgi:hypothetical protein
MHNAANSIEDVENLNDWQPQHYVLPLSEKQAVSFERKNAKQGDNKRHCTNLFKVIETTCH